MRRYSTTSAPDVGTTGGSKGACAAIALGSALLVGSTVAAIAQSVPPNPSANHAWGGCTLTPEAVAALEASITGEPDDPNGFFATDRVDFRVSFVMVYALENDNDGQPLAGGTQPTFTGVILCTNPDEVSIQTTTETTALPNVDILDGEQTFVLQYRLGGNIEKRVCQHTDSNTDCFRVF